MTKVEIIQDTVDYYSADVVGRRSLAGQNCRYKGPNGKECAFQRCVIDDLSPSEGSGCGMFDLKAIQFKPEYAGHDEGRTDQSFWTSIQHLHDSNIYWSSEGLSANGMKFVHDLKERYKNQ